MLGDRFVENLTTFIITDNNYSDSSLISLHSFRKYHPYPVKAYCLDFTDDEFERYKDNTSEISDITPVKWKLRKIDPSYYAWNKFYAKVFGQISAKFDILNDIHTNWALYFDTDTLFINNIDGIFDNPDELNGVCLNKTQVDVNCGLFLLKNRKIDYFTEYVKYCKEHNTDYFGIDEGFLSTLYRGKIKQLPNYYGINGYYDLTEDTKMIHYMGAIKPFKMDDDYNLMCLWFNRYFKQWYDYYDSVKDLFTFSERFNNDVNRIRNMTFNVSRMGTAHPEMRMFMKAGEKGLQLVMNKMISDYKRGKQ